MKKINLKLIILLILSIASIIFTYNDYFLYKTPILKITNIDNVLQESTIKGEDYYNQIITGKIMNGKYKGNTLTVKNTASTSNVYGDTIKNNSELFIEVSSDGTKAIRITNIKRDKYLVILLVIFIDLIIITAGKKGLKTLGSLLGNIIITGIAIFTFKNNYKTLNMLLLYFIVSIIFIIFSLYITNGKSKKTLSAIISSIASLFISFGLSFLLIKIYGKDISIWTMEYIEVVYDYENFFYVSILLCGLGAIMDIAITISSSLNELIVKNPKIDRESLIKSGKEISKDIVGTMTNVMLYTCYTPVIPTVLLAVKNNITIANALSLYGSLELIIVLCSCISIVLTIPISLYISIFILHKTEVRK